MNKHSSKKNYIKKIILFLIPLIITVGIGFYFYNQNKMKALYQEQPTEQEIFYFNPFSSLISTYLPTPTPTSNTQTNTNIKQNFTFKEFRLGLYRMVMYYPSDSTGSPDKSKAPFPVVVFHHGLAAKYAYYTYIAEALAEKGYLVVMPNRLIFGTNLNEGVEATKLVFNYLSYHNRYKSDKFYQLIDLNNGAVAGHSMGSMVALSLANELDTAIKIKAITAFSPGSTNISNSNETIKTLASFMQGSSMGKSMEEEIKKMYEAVGKTNVPIMYISGSEDGFCPSDGAIDLYNKTNSQKAIAVIEGGNHVQFVQGGANETEVMTNLDNKATISAEDQQKIGLKYFIAWMDYLLKGDQSAKAILDAGKQEVPASLSYYNLSL